MKKIVGITGGIASGKSTVINYLLEKEYAVIDSDVISRDLTSNNGLALNAIMKTFGTDFFDNAGNLNRQKLGELIFNNEDERQKLNNIIHPLVYNQIKISVNEIKKDIVFVDVPLLFEAKFEDLFDHIILIYVSRDTQISRLSSRNNLSFDEAMSRINSQMNLEEKIELSDFVIDNNGSKEDMFVKIEKILKLIKE